MEKEFKYTRQGLIETAKHAFPEYQGERETSGRLRLGVSPTKTCFSLDLSTGGWVDFKKNIRGNSLQLGYYAVTKDTARPGHPDDIKRAERMINGGWEFPENSPLKNRVKVSPTPPPLPQKTSEKEILSKRWSKLPVAVEHAYAKKKGFDCARYGFRLDKQKLVIPGYSLENNGGVELYQLISPDGRKRFAKGSSGSGVCNPMGDFDLMKEALSSQAKISPVALCEGVATGAALLEMGVENVLVCFWAGNLLKVFDILREKHPLTEVKVFADNDAGRSNNPHAMEQWERSIEVGRAGEGRRIPNTGVGMAWQSSREGLRWFWPTKDVERREGFDFQDLKELGGELDPYAFKEKFREDRGVEELVAVLPLLCKEHEISSEVSRYVNLPKEASSLEKDILVLHSDMGTGKTEAIKKIIHGLSSTTRIVYPSHRRTLAKGFEARFKAEGFVSHIKAADEEEERALDSDCVIPGRLAICLPSLVNESHIKATEVFDLVILDEVSQILSAFLDQSTFEGKEVNCFRKFVHLLKNAKRIILADANVSAPDLREILSLIGEERSVHLHINRYKAMQGMDVVLLPTAAKVQRLIDRDISVELTQKLRNCDFKAGIPTELSESEILGVQKNLGENEPLEEALRVALRNKVEAFFDSHLEEHPGKEDPRRPSPVFFCTDNRRQAEAAFERLKNGVGPLHKRFGLGLKVLLISKFTAGEVWPLVEKNGFEGWDVVIYTPVVGSGVSFDAPYFKRGYFIFSGVILSSDGIQMLRRYRPKVPLSGHVKERGMGGIDGSLATIREEVEKGRALEFRNFDRDKGLVELSQDEYLGEVKRRWGAFDELLARRLLLQRQALWENRCNFISELKFRGAKISCFEDLIRQEAENRFVPAGELTPDFFDEKTRESWRTVIGARLAAGGRSLEELSANEYACLEAEKMNQEVSSWVQKLKMKAVGESDEERTVRQCGAVTDEEFSKEALLQELFIPKVARVFWREYDPNLGGYSTWEKEAKEIRLRKIHEAAVISKKEYLRRFSLSRDLTEAEIFENQKFYFLENTGLPASLDNIRREGEGRLIKRDRAYTEVIKVPKDIAFYRSKREKDEDRPAIFSRNPITTMGFLKAIAECYGVKFFIDSEGLLEADCSDAIYSKWTVMKNLKDRGLWSSLLKNLEAINGLGLAGVRRLTRKQFFDEKTTIISSLSKFLAAHGIYRDPEGSKELPMRSLTEAEMSTREEHLAECNSPPELPPGGRIRVRDHRLTLGDDFRLQIKARQLDLAKERWEDIRVLIADESRHAFSPDVEDQAATATAAATETALAQAVAEAVAVKEEEVFSENEGFWTEELVAEVDELFINNPKLLEEPRPIEDGPAELPGQEEDEEGIRDIFRNLGKADKQWPWGRGYARQRVVWESETEEWVGGEISGKIAQKDRGGKPARVSAS